MKFFKNKPVAIAVMVVAIFMAILIGQARKPDVVIPEGGVKLDQTLSTAYFKEYVVDGAKLLSSKTEETISLYNANWDQLSGSIMAVVTVKSTDSGAEDAAWDWAEQLQLGQNDAILLIDEGSGTYSVVASGTFYDRIAAQATSFVDTCLYEHVEKKDYDSAAISLFSQVHLLFDQQGVSSTPSGGSGVLGAVVSVLLLILVLWLVFTVIDEIRYSSWHGRYGSMASPVVVYRPVLWWHRPGTPWFRKKRQSHNRPGGGTRPPSGGGTRPPMGGGSSRPASRPSGGTRTTPRSGSFGGTRGSNFGSSTRSGGFGNSRGGSFGSSSRGSFGGSTRGGSFGGRSGGSFGGRSGGRGGSFGGRR